MAILSEFQKEQEKWQSQISLKNNFQVEDIRQVAGVDLAYWQEGEQEYGVCSIVVMDYQTMEVIEEVAYYDRITVPYISGYLAFRELPLVLEAVKKLTVDPDIYMFDGNGYLHVRHMGIATHASFYLKKPTIGVAKNYFTIENAVFDKPSIEKGSYELIKVEEDVYGMVLRSRTNLCFLWELDRFRDGKRAGSAFCSKGQPVACTCQICRSGNTQKARRLSKIKMVSILKSIRVSKRSIKA